MSRLLYQAELLRRVGRRRAPGCEAAAVQSPLTESNRRPSPYHGDALPTELRGREPDENTCSRPAAIEPVRAAPPDATRGHDRRSRPRRGAWQVKDSNLRRLSRRIYSPLPLATRATCRAPPRISDRTGGGQTGPARSPSGPAGPGRPRAPRCRRSGRRQVAPRVRDSSRRCQRRRRGAGCHRLRTGRLLRSAPVRPARPIPTSIAGSSQRRSGSSPAAAPIRWVTATSRNTAPAIRDTQSSSCRFIAASPSPLRGRPRRRS